MTHINKPVTVKHSTFYTWFAYISAAFFFGLTYVLAYRVVLPLTPEADFGFRSGAYAVLAEVVAAIVAAGSGALVLAGLFGRDGAIRRVKALVLVSTAVALASALLTSFPLASFWLVAGVVFAAALIVIVLSDRLRFS